MNVLKKAAFLTFCSLTVALTPMVILADVTFPVAQVVSQLRQTQVPILLPSSIPDMDRLFTSVTAEPNGYSVSFDFVADCQGATPCNFGSISAERGGQLEAPFPDQQSETVQLTNGSQGQFVSGCGAYCSATLSWQSQGVLYTVYIKNGERDQVVQLANSAIAAGPRSVPQSQPSPSSSGAAAVLVSRDPGSRINVREAANPRARATAYGLAGDRVSILSQSNGTDGAVWYRVRFQQSGAIGWIRNNFVSRTSGR